MYYLSIAIVSLSGVLYHVSQKSINENANPMVSMMVTFTVALFGTIAWYLIDNSVSAWFSHVKQLNWASITLGISLVGLEFGVLLAYRTGWQVSSFNIVYAFLLAAMLLPIGLIIYKEAVSARAIMGMVVAFAGIVLMKM